MQIAQIQADNKGLLESCKLCTPLILYMLFHSLLAAVKEVLRYFT